VCRPHASLCTAFQPSSLPVLDLLHTANPALARCTRLDGTGVLQQAIELRFLRLQIAVSTNVLLRDEDIGDASLAGNFLEGILESCAIIDFIQLHQEVLRVQLIEQRLARPTVRTITLGEHDDTVLVDDLLGLFLCGDHGCG